MMEEAPDEASREGLRAKLKSPPTISTPVENVVIVYRVSRKKGTCCLLRAYRLASVMGIL